MEIGKLPNNILKEVIIDKLNVKRKEVILRPGLGEDCCAIRNTENSYILSSDPITGTAKNIGSLAVNVACNDIASSGVMPIGLIMTILLPKQSTIEDIKEIIEDINRACEELNVEIIGGHTEVTDAVNRVVISSTVVGNVSEEQIVMTQGAKLGDKVIMTKTAGIEATAIIANEKELELEEKFGHEFVAEAKKYINNISVLKEGIIAGKCRVNSMHDITEGGVYGAAWEIAEASGVGIKIYEENIPVTEITRKICEVYNIDYRRVISSGSMMITTNNELNLMNEFKKEGIEAYVIGEIIEDKKVIIDKNSKEYLMVQPESDELYKVI